MTDFAQLIDGTVKLTYTNPTRFAGWPFFAGRAVSTYPAQSPEEWVPL